MTDIRASMLALILENMVLLAEVNDHRQERGFEPLKEHLLS